MTLQQPIPFRATGAQRSFGQFLMDRGVLNSSQMLRANGEMTRGGTDLGEVLIAQGQLTPDSHADLVAEWLGLPRMGAAQLTPDRTQLAQIGAQTCLKLGIVPLGLQNGQTLVATANPARLDAQLADLPVDWGIVQPVIARLEDIHAALARSCRISLTQAAQSRTPEAESCRRWERASRLRVVLTGLAVVLALTITIWKPIEIFTTLTFWAAFTMLVAAVMKTGSLLGFLTRKPAPPPCPPQRLPRISVLVPLFRETEVAQVLLHRLERLTYPKSLLDVVLVLEENDQLTRDAIARATLPHWMRVVVVPEGQPKTKPRAMNYALDFCQGEIIGIFDAEDAPEPDQLDKVAVHFAAAADDLVCVQGVLDYYNARQNWLSRCFTIEYATWFRVMMPGMARLGFAIPLGGTTLYFRREPLERLGGWDAHNVTEDADLGFRLARHGYRTEMLASTTREEANCHVIPWVKQRSRWLKGYMVTYLVHMRRPARLFRDLGAWKFLGFQTHFITALSQFLLAPLLWSMWLIVFGFYHPLTEIVSDQVILTMGALFFGVELCTMAAAFIAVSGRAHRHLLPWVPTIHLYFPLGVLAAYKALYELVFAPFYWDKTEHGHSLSNAGLSGSAAGIQLQPRHESL